MVRVLTERHAGYRHGRFSNSWAGVHASFLDEIGAVGVAVQGAGSGKGQQKGDGEAGEQGRADAHDAWGTGSGVAGFPDRPFILPGRY